MPGLGRFGELAELASGGLGGALARLRAAFFSAAPPLLFAAATLALSASMRSITGAVSATGSGTAISSPRSLASSSARRSCR